MMSSAAVGAGNKAPTFNLVRWFGLVSACAIIVLAGIAAWSMQRFMTENILARDAETMMLFINSIVQDEQAEGYFLGEAPARGDRHVGDFYAHLGNMPGVLRANAYNLGRQVIWSTDPSLVGRVETHNVELERALGGRPVVESGYAGSHDKPEHAGLAESGTFFVENYLPIWSRSGGPRVIGVVEVYRTPEALAHAIHRGRQMVIAGAVGAGLVLYCALFWLIARAARLIEAQQRELIATRTLAASGEVASAVAHGLRNPLAAIRSAAELSLDGDPAEQQRLLREIIADTDRLEEWVREYLHYARAEAVEPEPLPLGPALERCLAQIAAQCRQRGIEVDVRLAPDLPPCLAEPLLLGQAVSSLLTNAVEAMPDGGRLSVEARLKGEIHILVRVMDTGPGMSSTELQSAFLPYYSRKPGGLGLGLPLARQIAQRLGGSLDLMSLPGQGTEARLLLLGAGS
ncbi:sensor histidine kinase [Geminicoccus harenae]|uniref:sensor histidine kinase n=1 Tax=Geminicoccus harenae TaxID=2498453 RepID=UPI00168AAD64|nr:HAMP domain-containing sensor histidine kinase [Geminicoccus harenae]